MGSGGTGETAEPSEPGVLRPLGLELAEGSSRRPESDAIARPEAQRLDDDATAALLARLPAPVEPPTIAESGFALRAATKPRPRPGRVVDIPFPPPTAADGQPQRPTDTVTPALEVVRYQPEGDVDVASGVSITFSAPMVPLDSVDAAVVTDPPVRLDPQPPGEWRRMDPRTLVFAPQDERMPMATDYRVHIPAGTAATTGATLADDVVFGFATPAPGLVGSTPRGDRVRPDTTVMFVFDQPVDADAVLAATALKDGRRALPLRAATDAEIAADAAASRLAAGVPPGRTVALRPTASLPLDTTVTVTLKAGVRSLEGPKVTDSPHTWKFSTPGPFRVGGVVPPWRGGKPAPGDPWSIELSNPVDVTSFDESMVTVDPPVDRLRAEVAGSYLTVTAAGVAGQSYTVALDLALRDVFGQTLEPSDPLRVDVGQPEPRLTILGGEHIILDPNGAPVLAVRSIGIQRIRVGVYGVGSEDWAAWRESRESRRYTGDAAVPGERVAELVLTVANAGLAWADTDVDLSPWLDDGLGQVVVVVEPEDPTVMKDLLRLTAASWVQATRLGVDSLADATTLRAWVTDLATGAPMAGATATLGAASAVTGQDGMCELPLSRRPEALLTVRHDRDLALLPDDGWSGGWRRGEVIDRETYFLFDDRGLYRPGEQVRIKGWVRVLTGGPAGDVAPKPKEMATVDWSVDDRQYNEIASGSAPLDELGGFDITIDLPGTVNLGNASVSVNGDVCHRFRIAEFRRPEYEVSVTVAPDRAVAGDTLTATAQADYYAGGPLRAAPVGWSVTATPARYTPPGWDRFSFGTATFWRGWNPWDEDPAGVRSHFESVTGDDGSHHLGIATVPGSDPQCWSVSAEATVQDVNRQAWTASAAVLVHPSQLCVGLRSSRSFVTAGRPLEIEAVVVDLDGAPVPGVPIGVRAERREDRQIAGEWREVVAETVEREARSGTDVIGLSLDGLTPGRWTVTAEAADDAGRAHRSSLEIWVAGAASGVDRRAGSDELQLIPDRQDYQPGDVAEVLIRSPFTPAHGVMILERDGVVSTESLEITADENSGAVHTLRIPLPDAFTPGVHVEVMLAGATARPDAPAGATRPAYAASTVYLPVRPVTRTLTVAVTPREPGLRPGEGTVLDLAVTGADGTPVAGAGATVIVVDESVLALAAYTNPDPFAVFYPQRGPGVVTTRSRPSVLLARPDLLDVPSAVRDALADEYDYGVAPTGALMMKAAPGGFEHPAPPIRARSDFSALALFAASVTTDADGRAAVPVTLPDNLTRYRVLVVATDGAARFGVGESSLTARLPLMVRPSAPRFLSWGDTFELPVVIQNQTEAPLEVDVAVRAGNAALTAGAGRRLTVPGNDRAEVRFPAAAEAVGQARFEVAAASGPDADAATVALPVWSPATTEAFALHGVLDDGAVDQPLRAPAGAVPSFGGLEVTTSSTGVAALADAVAYLTAYPFDCAEQLASRVLSIAALRDVLAAFGTDGQASPADLEAAVRRDIDTLATRQGADGGFGWWRRSDDSWPYLSVHVGNALARARAKGFEVPERLVSELLRYLQTIGDRFPRDYPADARAAIEAYALSVRAALGDPDPAAARRLAAAGPSAEGLAWLLPILAADDASREEAAEVRRQLANRVVETPGAASVTVHYHDGAHLVLASDRRADAVVLEALIADQPDSDLIPKLVAGLLGHRTAGRWATTQENAFVLLALGRYFDTYESVTPDFTARLWLGEDFAGEQSFHGRSTDVRHLAVPMTALAGGQQDLLLAKDGPGRLYYRLGLRYAPADLSLEPLDRGFAVSRTYEAMDDPDDVRRDDDGTWRIRAGACVRVGLTMTARARRYHVALVDPLPAGLEPLDPALATTASDAATDGSDVGVLGGPGLGGPGRRAGHWWWWIRPWFDHENLRDERAEAFTTLLWEGTYRYRYTARATTPGTFTAAPPKAEEMYSPEVFGRGGTDRVVVE